MHQLIPRIELRGRGQGAAYHMLPFQRIIRLNRALIKSVNLDNETSGSIFELKLERREVWPLTKKPMEEKSETVFNKKVWPLMYNDTGEICELKIKRFE